MIHYDSSAGRWKLQVELCSLQSIILSGIIIWNRLTKPGSHINDPVTIKWKGERGETITRHIALLFAWYDNLELFYKPIFLHNRSRGRKYYTIRHGSLRIHFKIVRWDGRTWKHQKEPPTIHVDGHTKEVTMIGNLSKYGISLHRCLTEFHFRVWVALLSNVENIREAFFFYM